MDLLGQSALIVGVTSLGLGASVVYRNIQNRLYWAFGALCLTISVWSILFFIHRLFPDRGWYGWHLVAHVWLAPAGVYFAQMLTQDREAWIRRVVSVSVLFAVAGTGVCALGWEHRPGFREWVVFLPALVFGVTLVLQARSVQFRLSGRRALIFVGSWIALGTAVMDHIQGYPSAVPVIGNLFLASYLFFLAQAITQQRLLNVRALFARFIMMLVLALALSAIYSTFFAFVERNTPLFFLNSFIVSFLLLLGMEPLQALVSYVTSHWITQEHRRIKGSVEAAQQKLIGVVDADVLWNQLLQTAQDFFEPLETSVFALDPDRTRFVRVRHFTQRPNEDASELGMVRVETPTEVLANHPIVDQLAAIHAHTDWPFVLDQLVDAELERTSSRKIRTRQRQVIAFLRGFQSNLLIALFEGKRLSAFVTVRLDGPPEGWGGSWGLLRTLVPFYRAAEDVLQNLQIFQRSREKERLATVGVMAAGLAHEIRNPLGAIKGAAQILQGTQLPSEDGKLIHVIVEEVDRLNRVVSRFLDYSKPLPSELQRVDLRRIVERSDEVFRTNLSPGVESRLELGLDPLWVRVAVDQVQQVILNLVQNAESVLREQKSGGLISISARKQSGRVVLTVEDNGPGVSEENLGKLFIPFFTTKSSGTGLGLSICQKIIESHRGRIEVATELGKFTRFTVILPESILT